MSDLSVEILDQNWSRKGITGSVRRCSITEELGRVGEASGALPIDDPVIQSLPDPDAANPYEGRFRVYEDGSLKFAGVIDATSIQVSADGAAVEFSGKHRGVELGFYNLGRVDYLGWPLPALFRELLRNNIAKNAVLQSVSSESELYGAYQALTGDPFKQNYWKSGTSTPNHTMIIDLGSSVSINAIRVMPIWWADVGTNPPGSHWFHYTNFTVETSDNPSSGYTTQGTKNDSFPSTSQGHLYETPSTAARYVRLTVTGSTDGYARIAQLMVYQNIASIGGATTYITPFVENDDSGNMTVTGTTSRPIVPGAFQGDGVITHSAVTRLAVNGAIQQRFRGTQSAVFFTSHTDGASTAQIHVDGVDKGQISIPNNKYWFKGYETDLLTNGVHTLKVTGVSGNVQVDYFNGLYETSWRPIEDDDPSIAYKSATTAVAGGWRPVQAEYYHNFFAVQSKAANNELHYNFVGDRIKIIGEKGPGHGSIQVYIDGILQSTVSLANATAVHKQTLFDWSGSYATHTLRVVTVNASTAEIDRLEGNFQHTLYLRSRYEPNLKLLTRLSEILDSYLRFNDDGSVDLLGSVGTYGGTIIREGENEGGTIISSNVENDYSETGSAVLALVNVNGELPIKSFVIDKEAVAEIGFKIIRLENSDAADQFLLNRQALQFLREHRKPNRSYNVQFGADGHGDLNVGETTKLYAPISKLDGDQFRIGKIVTDYENE